MQTQLNTSMKSDDLVEQGNQLRADRKPHEALALYAQAFVQDRKHVSAFNNYGNVLREIGDPAGGIPFLEHALTMYPDFVTAKFNLAVCHLLLGNYEKVGQLMKQDGSTSTLPERCLLFHSLDGKARILKTKPYWLWVNRAMETTYNFQDLFLIYILRVPK